LTRDGIHTRRFHSERVADRTDGLTRAHADVHADTDGAQAGKFTGTARGQSFEAALLNEGGDSLLVQRGKPQVQVRRVLLGEWLNTSACLPAHLRA
jgi:hypothetical protein